MQKERALTDLTIDPATTALVAIDLQQGVVALATVPQAALDVVERTASIANALRRAGGTVVFVRVQNLTDGKDMLAPKLDAPAKAGARAANWSEIVPAVGRQPGDLLITKRQWGAFYGTDLDLQLRRRGIRTLVMTGVATNIGVESTARDAFERGYDQIFAEDAMAALTEEGHRYACKTIFPRMGRVRSTAQVLAALG
jgi:nicotinamidase-related amidase